MDFKEATTRLTTCVTQDEIAGAVGVSRNSVSRARLDPSTSSYRSPPDGWRKAIAKLARARAAELEALAEELEE